MRDPIREAFTRLGDKVLINLEELKYLINDRQFWVGTLTFMVMALVILLDGCMRRGV
jgi:hypothetical protein